MPLAIQETCREPFVCGPAEVSKFVIMFTVVTREDNPPVRVITVFSAPRFDFMSNVKII
jgi:hypothetical protein